MGAIFYVIVVFILIICGCNFIVALLWPAIFYIIAAIVKGVFGKFFN